MSLKLTLLSDGWCEQLEHVAIRGGKFRRIRFASMFALIEHPHAGPILFDTGYTNRFFTETQKLPARLYRWVTPVHFHDLGDIATQLRTRGIAASEVRHVIISHFHADHVGGLRDFPNARFHCTRAAWDAVKNLRGWRATRHAYLPGLLPPDFPARAVFAEDQSQIILPSNLAPFVEARDLFGDGTLLAVDLPGHAIGQMGVFLKANAQDWLLAADACWLSRAYREALMPHPVVRSLVDWKAYAHSLKKLHQLYRGNPNVRIVPTHCPEIWALPS